MSAWSGLAKAVGKLFGRGGFAATASTARVAGEAIQAGARTVVTWGNAFKVAIAGGLTWLFLNGGASNVVATTLGISQGAAQILIIFGFVVMMIIITRYIVNYVRGRFNLRQEYFDSPVLRSVDRHQDDYDGWMGRYR